MYKNAKPKLKAQVCPYALRIICPVTTQCQIIKAIITIKANTATLSIIIEAIPGKAIKLIKASAPRKALVVCQNRSSFRARYNISQLKPTTNTADKLACNSEANQSA
jgi:hypothetical protein